MMGDNIIQALDRGERCWITFKSMTSDAEYTHLYEGSCYPSNGDKLLVVNVDTKELEDIEKASIIGWQRSPVPGWGFEAP
tara:strand:+ start:1356 stop:1595 length:240 start_codon:yes stop_codon:yes gene_type:complete